MMINPKISVNILFFILTGTAVFSQTGESMFKEVRVNMQEKTVSDIIPVCRIVGLDFTRKDNLRQIDSEVAGQLNFYLVNTGVNSLEALEINIDDLNNTGGLSFKKKHVIPEIEAGDSSLVTIPLSAIDYLEEGDALFSILVTDSKNRVNQTAQITVPVKESSGIPLFTWENPVSALERIDFPLYEISGKLRSKIRITGLDIYVNGMIPGDKKSFTILPSEKQGEYIVKRVLTLEEGYNEITLEAKNDLGSVVSEPRVINYFVQKVDPLYREKRIALVIGNADYVHGNILNNPINDAMSFAAALENLGFTVMNFLNADQKEMKMAIDEFGQKLPGYHVGLFYFAGHGMQVNGVNYLIPVDANLRIQQDVEYDCVDVGRLLGKMEGAGTSTNIVILDACRDNPFERSWSGRSGDRGKGLAFMNAPSGSIIAYATSPGKTASDGTGKHGLYTEALLQFIDVPGLPIEEFFKNVRTVVEIRSNKAQIPWESTSLKGNFFFRMQ